MSSNPFRKKALEAVDTARVQSPVKSSLRSDSPLADDAAPIKSKPVKKVRVLSPPPLSPDSPEWSTYAALGHDKPEARHLFEHGISPVDDSSRDGVPTRLGGSAGQHEPPPNPFSKTLQDLEGFAKERESQTRDEGAALKAGNAARQSLNVDSFRRLLMTGQVSDTAPLLTQDLSARDASVSSGAPASKDSHTGEADKEEQEDSLEESSHSPVTSDDADDNDGPVSRSSLSEQKGKEKKAPPPPPNSRHGKSLRVEHTVADVPKVGSTTDINKPLPPAPVRRSIDGDVVSPFDHESAGKAPVPEPGLEPGLASHSAAVVHPGSGKKPAPAPPPRRSHARSETKSQKPAYPNVEQPQTPSKANCNGGTSVRTSIDETPSWSEGPRQTGHAPAPPPPRRPHAAPRPTSQAASRSVSSSHVTQSSSSSSTHPHEPDHDHSANPDAPAATTAQGAHAGSTKLSSPPPPRPPPARNSSVRRPPSLSSVDGISRRVSGEGRARDGVPPPPPPPRQRGNSSSSLDVLPRRTSVEATSRPSLDERPSVASYDGAGTSAGNREDTESGKGFDILADLDALRREVDALRGKLG